MGSNFPKCSVPGCNQHRTATSELCGTHRIGELARMERENERAAWLDEINEATTVEHLKGVLTALVERVFA